MINQMYNLYINNYPTLIRSYKITQNVINIRSILELLNVCMDNESLELITEFTETLHNTGAIDIEFIDHNGIKKDLKLFLNDYLCQDTVSKDIFTLSEDAFLNHFHSIKEII